jgi:hypothetical protein
LDFGLAHTDRRGVDRAMTCAWARRKARRLPRLCLQIAVAVLLGALPISAWAHREAMGREAPADSISTNALTPTWRRRGRFFCICRRCRATARPSRHSSPK